MLIITILPFISFLNYTYKSKVLPAIFSPDDDEMHCLLITLLRHFSCCFFTNIYTYIYCNYH